MTPRFSESRNLEKVGRIDGLRTFGLARHQMEVVRSQNAEAGWPTPEVRIGASGLFPVLGRTCRDALDEQNRYAPNKSWLRLSRLPRGGLRFGVALDAVAILAAVELPAEVSRSGRGDKLPAQARPRDPRSTHRGFAPLPP